MEKDYTKITQERLAAHHRIGRTAETVLLCSILMLGVFGILCVAERAVTRQDTICQEGGC